MDEWYHLVATHNADTLTFYVNGVELASMYNTEVYNASSGGAHTITKAWLGNRPEQTDGFEGLMGLVRVYDRPLTQGEIIQNYFDVPSSVLKLAPEPGTVTLLIGGALAVLLLVRRRCSN